MTIYLRRTSVVFLASLMLAGCGGGGGSSQPPPPADGSSNWDELVWDQGDWV